MGIGIKIGFDIGSKLGTSPYGAELVTDPNFTNGLSNWLTPSGGWSMVSTRAYQNTGTFLPLVTDIDIFEDGKTYLITIDYEIVSGSFKILASPAVVIGTFQIDVISTLGVNTYTTEYTHSGSTQPRLAIGRNSTVEYYLSKVSIKEIL